MKKEEIKLDYKELFDKMLNGFAYHKLILNDDGEPVDYVFLEINNAFEDLTGLKREEIIGNKVTDIIRGIEKEKAKWIKRYGKVGLSGQEERFEAYAEHIGKWYDIHAYSPKTGYFAVILSDITEKKKATQNAREKDLKYKRLLDKTNDMVTILDLSLRPTYKYVNLAHTINLGYKQEEFFGKSPLDFIHPDDRENILKPLEEVISQKEKAKNNGNYDPDPVETTYRIKKKNGNYIVVESTAVLLGEEIFAISRDVTSKQKYVRDLKAEKERAEMYLDISGNIILELDLDLHIIRINNTGAKILGAKEKDLVGKNWLSYVPENEREEIRNIQADIVNAKSDLEYVESRVIDGEAKARLLRWHNMVLKDEDGKIRGTLSSGQDISNIKATELELRKKIDDFEKFNRIAVGRELKMIELKKELKKCQSRLAKTNIKHEEEEKSE